MSAIKLVYFDIRGRGEYIRMLLEAAGKRYEEKRIKFEDWPAEKPNTPFGSLPYIVYNGKQYGQSHAIAIFLAREFGFYGKTPVDGLRVSEVVGLWEDQVQRFVKHRFPKDDAAKAEAEKKLIEEDIPKFFGIYEKLLKEGGSFGYFVNNQLSLAEMYVYDIQDNVLQLNKDALKSYPLLQKLRQNVESHPKLKAYLAERKETKF